MKGKSMDRDYSCSKVIGYDDGYRQGEYDAIKKVSIYPDGPNDTEYAKGWIAGYQAANPYASKEPPHE